jgi:hypothetical protein
VIFSYVDKQMRMTPRKVIKALTGGAKDGLPLLAICALISVVLNAINSTGIGLKFSQIIASYAKENLLQALFITMFAALVLGMRYGPAYRARLPNGGPRGRFRLKYLGVGNPDCPFVCVLLCGGLRKRLFSKGMFCSD